MADKPITIHSPCFTSPELDVRVRIGDLVRWKADHAEMYLLEIPGGFFKDYPDDFEILVFGTRWTGYYEVEGRKVDRFSNYIYNLSGNCSLGALAGPPDVIIDSTLGKGAGKGGSKKGKKKKA
jgi:hypothetical protein